MINAQTRMVWTVVDSDVKRESAGLSHFFLVREKKVSKGTKKVLKYGLNILIIAILSFIAMKIIFKNNEPKEIWQQIKLAKLGWLALAAVLMLVFVCCESVILHRLFKGLKQKMSAVKCVFLAFIEFFYSQITPGASGGQPVQIFYMGRCGVNPFISTMVCMVVTLTYKFMLVILCVLAFILRPSLCMDAISEVWVLFIIGVIMQAGFAAFLLIAVMKPSIANWIINTLVKLGIKLRIIRHPDNIIKKAADSLAQYDQASKYLKENKRVLLFAFVVTFFQRVMYYSVTFCVAMALGVDCNYIDVIALQLMLSMSVDALPIPGATGVNELVFGKLQVWIFGEAKVATGLLLNRGFTYYLLAIESGIMTLLGHLFVLKPEKVLVTEVADRTAADQKTESED